VDDRDRHAPEALPAQQPVTQPEVDRALAGPLLLQPRDDRALPAWRATATARGFQLDLPAEWLQANPWTAAALGEEATVWKQVGREYLVKGRASKKSV
jgi:hypothetical protein